MAKREARRGARTHNLEIKSLTRYRLCQPGLLKLLCLLKTKKIRCFML
jgi:hypothetical protein